MDQAKWRNRRDILISVLCAGIIIYTLWLMVTRFIEAILLLLVAATISYLITPLTNVLEERCHIPRVLATILTYIVVLAFIGLLAYIMVYSLIDQLTRLAGAISSFVVTVPDRYSSAISFLRNNVGIPQSSIDTTIDNFSKQISTITQSIVNNIVKYILIFTNTIVQAMIVIIISFYLTLDGKRIWKSIVSVIPQQSMPNVLLFGSSLASVVGRYIRGQFMLALIVGFLTTVISSLLGLQQFATVFGLLGFLFETIPMIGPFLASILPIAVSLMLPDPFPRTIFVIMSFFFLQIIESNVLGPRIVGRAVGLHPAVSIIMLLLFTKLFSIPFGAFGGALGALLATPIAAALWVVIVAIYRSFHGKPLQEEKAPQTAFWSFKHPTQGHK